MKQDYQVGNQLGLHVKPSKQIAQAAEKYVCEISLSSNGKCGNAKNMIEILKLGAKRGDTVTLITNGPDERKAQEEIGSLICVGKFG